jgi:hypothetical protein
LFVLAALALAVLIIGVALLLNSGVYSANLAAQNADGGVEEPREFLREAEIGANRVMEYSNYNNFSSYADLRRNFTVGVHNWSDRAHDHRARTGEGIEIREVNVTNGTRITQDTDTREFRNESRTVNWTVATGLGGVRQFRMNITTATLPNTSSVDTRNKYLTSEYFRIKVTPDGGSTKRIYVYGNNTGEAALVRVAGGPSGLSPPCKAAANPNDRVTLYISDGLIGSEHCEALDFLDDPTTPFAINFTNGDSIEGSYELFVDGNFSAVDDGDFGTDSNSDPPGIQRAIYNGTVGIDYTAEDTLLKGNRTVSPDRRRFIGGGEAFTFSIAVGDWVTFAESGNLRVLNKSGASDDLNTNGNPRAIGPTAVSVNGDSTDDSNYMSTNGRVFSFPRDGMGTEDELASNGSGKYSTLGVGKWYDNDSSIFYPLEGSMGSDPPEIRLVNGTQSNPRNALLFNDAANGTSAIAGPANMTTDPGDELVYLDSDDNILYADNGSAFKAVPNGNLATYSNAPPLGTPADYNDNGTARVPFVDSGNEITLATKDGAMTTIPTGSDTPVAAPMATLDWDADGELDIIYINQSQNGLRVIYNVTGTNTVRPVNDSAGNQIVNVDTDVGVR